MKSLNFYKNKYKKFGVDPKSLVWKTRGAAHQRFRQFWSEIDFDNKRVLDVGCGFGEFGKFIIKRYNNVDYTGWDIVPEFIENAKKLVPKGKFEVVDYLNTKINEQYDIVIASGVLNSNTENNYNYRKNAILKMFNLTKNCLAFNMLGGFPPPDNKKSNNIWYSNSIKILQYCLTLTRRVILKQNYNPKDFTIFMYKIK